MDGNTVGGASLSADSITILGFLGSLFLINPVLTSVIVLAAVPILIGEMAMSRRYTKVAWRIGPLERREMFYGDLLSSVEAAKEIRLFAAGAFFQKRLLAERRVIDAARRDLDRRDLLVQGGLSGLTATVWGAGLLWAVNAARQGQLSAGDITMLIAAMTGT